jgi:hypothetical protein
MKMLLVAAAILVVFGEFVMADEPPSWLNLGDLSVANIVRDIIAVPGTDVILACGSGSAQWYFPCIWRSSDRGASWVTTLAYSWDGGNVPQLARDSATGRIWAIQTVGGYNQPHSPLYYSDDTGRTWTGVSAPYTPCAIEAVGNYLYYGGSCGSPYSIRLYRLSQDSLHWEMITDYLECDAITRLKYHDGKLLVFAHDKSVQQTRVFSCAP